MKPGLKNIHKTCRLGRYGGNPPEHIIFAPVKSHTRQIGFHLLAFGIVVVWGTTFVSTKLLLFAGLGPQDIFFYRFLLAYAGIWLAGGRRLRAGTWGDEGRLALLGVTGGSFYFLAENIALEYTFASNVALLVSTAPLLTALLAHFYMRGERLRRNIVTGLLVAFAGSALVVFNGNFILHMSPLGDVLSIAAALCWAFYTLILKGLSKKYDTVFITRKVFFYGLLTILPVFLFRPLNTDMAILSDPVVAGNLLYLGLVASLLCFLGWNMVVTRLGAVRTTNYVYFAPPVTLLTAAIVIDEPITAIALVGAALILLGVILAEKR